MIVSHDWLQQYVELPAELDHLTDRLTMSGLNLEGVEPVGDDVAIDLEVTSNRPDCLGHIGVAREVSVLFDEPLQIPDARPAETGSESAKAVTGVEIECPDLCRQYIARVIRGVRVGTSPQWLQQQLKSVGIAPINSIVDVTNYVLMECGQPLHAFDFDKLDEQRIVVREAREGETLVAIDHREYRLQPGMCVIADASQPVALGGVMGGASTEISDETANVLVEVANFAPLSIRNTARALNLHSDSSYRFERGVDVQQLHWASLRCCQLILEIAGGELLPGAAVAGDIPDADGEPIVLRLAQISRLLGIDVPHEEVVRILTSLGCRHEEGAAAGAVAVVPPSWRRDLTREVDLIEEVARIHGYDRIPEDAAIPIVAGGPTIADQVSDIVRNVLTAAGFDEAITMSFVGEDALRYFRPTDAPEPLRVEHSSRKQENVLRQSLLPSLIDCRRDNERQGSFDADLFEIADVYLGADPTSADAQPKRVGLVSGRSFRELKGVIEELAARCCPQLELRAEAAEIPGLQPGRTALLTLGERKLGHLGVLTAEAADAWNLRDSATCAEIDLAPLVESAELKREFTSLPQYPAIVRDLNFVVDDDLAWSELAETVRSAAGPLMERVSFVDQYTGQQIPAGKKSYVLSVSYRSPERTLTSEEVDTAQQQVVAAVTERHAATQR